MGLAPASIAARVFTRRDGLWMFEPGHGTTSPTSLRHTRRTPDGRTVLEP